jgi:hypothetical protein
MVPRHKVETLSPLRPRLRYSMLGFLPAAARGRRP